MRKEYMLNKIDESNEYIKSLLISQDEKIKVTNLINTLMETLNAKNDHCSCLLWNMNFNLNTIKEAIRNQIDEKKRELAELAVSFLQKEYDREYKKSKWFIEREEAKSKQVEVNK